jgi:hypothetical protein
MRRQRDFLLLVTLAATAATPALGQGAAAQVGPASSGMQGAASIPDFSGFWAHPYWPGFEPPASGPGPVVNKLRQRQTFDADGRRLPETNAPLVSNPQRLVGDHSNPILKAQAAEVVKQHGEMELSGGAPTTSNQCWPEPVPYIFWNVGMRMLQQPNKITILYYVDHEVRHVRMNQPHPAQLTPSLYGDSVGHYERDTLVIDTVGIKPGPVAMVDMYGLRTPRLCTWWNVIGCSITKPQKKRKNAVEKRIGGSAQTLPRAGYPIPATRARGCNSNSRSMMKAFSRRPGRRP